MEPAWGESDRQGGAGGKAEQGGLGREALGALKAALRERLANDGESEGGDGLTVSPRLRDVLAADFRANPAYELVEVDRLNPVVQDLLGVGGDEDCFGVLSPLAEADLAVKAVGNDTALLFYALGDPGRLPAFITRAADEEVNAQIAELVLDDILQIAVEGGFVSGAAANQVIFEPADAGERLGRISRISLDAVRFGQRLPVEDALTLAGQLYFFNRLPVTPSWQRRLGAEAAVRRFVGTDSGSLATALSSQWSELDRTAATRAWRRFALRDTVDQGRPPGDGYKVYVSPTLESIHDVLPTIVNVFAEKRVRLFKMGADLANLCRADKIVADLDSVEHVHEVGRVLNERLGDAQAQGVPFTADLCRDGLVSWGVEPRQPPVVVRDEYLGWRRWVAYRLASALLVARAAPGAAVEPWRSALQQVRLEGIDTDTWTPLSGIAGRSADGSVR